MSARRRHRSAALELLIALPLLVCLVVAGCKKNGPSGNIYSAAFDSAPAESKQSWNDAMSAWKNHKYLEAANKFASLQTAATNLSTEQKDALTKAMDEFGQEAFKKANDGDADATKAVQAVNAVMGRRSGGR